MRVYIYICSYVLCSGSIIIYINWSMSIYIQSSLSDLWSGSKVVWRLG